MMNQGNHQKSGLSTSSTIGSLTVLNKANWDVVMRIVLDISAIGVP